ncbi:chromate efflux transporter [Desertivirga xinjiangensis]|uniref:chromate efflux transporter n=1 Tax=Desertivirga xinjiangensis TaxID=539206 RepID=UPI00210E575C|nr:chromate efflux transporter [Pedobacter xinjiangensis]
MKTKHILFIRDVTLFTFTAFGGAQAHIGIMLKDFVKRRHYITEKELLELNALTQVLPGPSSTQTLVGIAYKVGGLWLSLLTFFIWIIPSAAAMCFFAVAYTFLDDKETFSSILKYVQPIAVGIVGFAAFSLARAILKTNVSIWLAFAAILVTLILKNAYVFPIMILLGGIISSALETSTEETEIRVKLFSSINKKKILYFLGVLMFFAALGAVINRTSPFSLPVRLFENFYRNGILIFGGGNVLVPLMFTEFVKMKQYISADVFISGYALQQALPGPTFSFTSFVGAMTMKHSGVGIGGQIIGSLVATLGINLPGLILVLFFVPFWEDLKKITRIRKSLSGVNAVSVGFIIAAFIFLLQPIELNVTSICLVAATFLILKFTMIRTPFLIIAGILMGMYL